MIKRDGHFTGQEGVRLFWQSWQPEESIRGVLLVCHGYGEHGGRYAPLVDHFVPRGFAVYALDHRGHGRSEGARGHVGRFAEFVSDFHSFRVRVEEERKGIPVILVGHSMGGLIAVHYVLRHGAGLAGVVLSSPALAIPEPPSLLLRLLSRVLSLVAPRASFQGPVNPELLSHDASVGRAYAADPLVHSRASARFFTEFTKSMREARERAAEVTLPILILQAGADRLVDPRAVEEFARQVKSSDGGFRLYADLYHEIFNETDKERVFSDLEQWLEERLAA